MPGGLLLIWYYSADWSGCQGGDYTKVTFLFCIIVALLILFDNSILFYSFLMVCAHESAHLFAMHLCGVAVREVSLEPFGILVKKEQKQLSLGAALAVIYAGCALHLLLGCVCMVLFLLFQNRFVLSLAAINAALLVLNLLPIQGLDGGQGLLAVLRRFCSEEKAVAAAKITSLCTSGALFAFGMIICFKVRLNPSICLLALFLLIQSLTNQFFYN